MKAADPGHMAEKMSKLSGRQLGAGPTGGRDVPVRGRISGALHAAWN